MQCLPSSHRRLGFNYAHFTEKKTEKRGRGEDDREKRDEQGLMWGVRDKKTSCLENSAFHSALFPPLSDSLLYPLCQETPAKKR